MHSPLREDILSGAQRFHNPVRLEEHALSHGIDVKTTSISTYIDAMRHGSPMHGGFGVGLERVMMLYCGLNKSRIKTLYPC
ncbi:hypothetical protein LguiA_001497 [Lonicera macranthoides]